MHMTKDVNNNVLELCGGVCVYFLGFFVKNDESSVCVLDFDLAGDEEDDDDDDGEEGI